MIYNLKLKETGGAVSYLFRYSSNFNLTLFVDVDSEAKTCIRVEYYVTVKFTRRTQTNFISFYFFLVLN